MGDAECIHGVLRDFSLRVLRLLDLLWIEGGVVTSVR